MSVALFWSLLALGLVGRLVLIFSNSIAIDADNAVVYLVAKHISEGDISWFFWGQDYGGTLLEFVAGGAMLVFGHSFEVLSIVGVLFFLGCTFVVRAIGRHAFENSRTGDVAAIIFWFSGYVMIRVGISEPGFYGPSLLLGLLTIWLALRGSAKKTYLQWGLIGVCFGLALWQSPMGAAVALPGFAIAALRHRSVSHIFVGLLAAVAGGLPWIINALTSAGAVKPQAGQGGITWFSLVSIFTKSMPENFQIHEAAPRYLVATCAVGVLVLLTVVGVIQSRRRNYWALTLMVSTALVVVTIVVGSATLLASGHVRYTVFVLPALCVGLGWLATRLPFTGNIAMLTVVALNIWQFQPTIRAFTLDTSDKYIPGDIRGLGDYLESAHITSVFATYWIAYSLSAETDEQVTAAALAGPGRRTQYETAARAAPTATVIVIAGAANDLALRAGDKLPPSTRTEVDGFAIYSFAQPFNALDYAWLPS